jgi:hypothetical protein
MPTAVKNATRFPITLGMIPGFALACSLVIAPAVAFAVAGGPDHFTTRNLAEGQSLTVHLGPSTSSAAAGRIAAGTRCIRNLGCRATTDSPPPGKAPPETWCEVQSGDVKGFAQARYLAEGSCDAKGASLPSPDGVERRANGAATVDIEGGLSLSPGGRGDRIRTFDPLHCS